ncbi:MAG: M28 family peptidase [Candidatus Promineifilaceae bacterium]|nr:M28 family peptidase [Candidatus Promineifilaceae bacterium]
MNSRFNARILVLFLILIGLCTLSLYKTRPPAAVPAGAPETAFSAERAMQHVIAIAQQPHVTGSSEIFAVRDYILSELTALGLDPEVQQTVAQSFLNEKNVALAENIIARIPGTDSTRAILLLGHYDTPDNSPGAGDNSTSVATLLETARALTASPPIKNDIILLFPDAEENTVAGAKAAQKHPLLSDVGLVLSLEMRGIGGPVYMFETGPNNGRIIPEFAKAVPHPSANSLQREVYAVMPNNTDFTGYRDAGYAGFNISTIERTTHYHAPMSTVEELDLGSLQHHGSYTLGIARHFGDLDLTNIEAGDAVYFDLLSAALIHYPGFLAVPLGILGLLLFMVLVIYGWRRGDLTWRGIGLGFLSTLVVLVSGPGAVTLLWFIIRATVNPTVILGDTYNSPLYFLSFGLLVVAITVALYGLFRRKVSTPDMAVGALSWWAILLLVTTVILPLASFVFLWPLMFALIAVGDLFLTDHQKPLTWVGVAILSIAALPGLLLIPPMTYSVAVGLVIVVSLTGASMILTVLLLGLLIPHLSALSWSESGLGQWWLPGGSAVIGLLLLLLAIFTTRIDTKNPRLVHLNYGLNAHTGEAIWASLQPSGAYLTDLSQEWTAQFFSDNAVVKTIPDFFGTNSRLYTVDRAPVLPLSPADVEMVEDIHDGDIRRLRLLITSSQGATETGFYIEPPAEIISAAINGEPIIVKDNPPDRQEMWELQYYGPLSAGMEMSLELKSPEAVEMLVVERVSGLPEIPEQDYAPLPDYLGPYADTDLPSHVTLISNTFTFD